MQPILEPKILREVAYPPPGETVLDRATEDSGAAGGRLHQTGQNLDRGGLTSTVRTEETEHLAGLDG